MDSNASGWLGLGAAALGNSFNYAATSATNRTGKKIARENNALQERLFNQQLDYNREMAQQSYEWNLEFWNQQNEYNSPYNTMQRLKAAGLNPNLIYGNGQATTPAGAISSPKTFGSPGAPHMQQPSLTAPRIDAGGIAEKLYNLSMMQENVKGKQLENQEQANRNSLFALNKTSIELNIVSQLIANAKDSITRDNLTEYYRALIGSLDSGSTRNSASAHNLDVNSSFLEGVLTPYYGAKTGESLASSADHYASAAVKQAQIGYIRATTASVLYDLHELKPIQKEQLQLSVVETSEKIINLRKDGKIKEAVLEYKNLENKLKEFSLPFEMMSAVLRPVKTIFDIYNDTMNSSANAVDALIPF